MSSSPCLPSPSEVFKQQIKSSRPEIRATPNPQSTTAQFTTAPTLLKLSVADQDFDLSRSLGIDINHEYSRRLADRNEPSGIIRVDDEETKPTKSSRTKVGIPPSATYGTNATKPRKPRLKNLEEIAVDDGTSAGSVCKRRRANKVDKNAGDHSSAKETTTKEPRARNIKKIATDNSSVTKNTAVKPKRKKGEAESQTKLPKSKITKLSRDSASIKSSNISVSCDLSHSNDFSDFGLIEAVKRKASWTPPMPTKTRSAAPASADSLGGLIDFGNLDASMERSNGFKDLFGTFGFAEADQNISEKKADSHHSFVKRKLIEPIQTKNSETKFMPYVEKVPKKKARTITERATSAYVQEAKDTAKTAPLLQYLECRAQDRSGNGLFEAPSSRHIRSPAKRSAKPKIGSSALPILLSPKSAMKEAGNQEYLFGTSSQLAREKSPTLLRDLHEAMQASNMSEDPFSDTNDEKDSPTTMFGKGKVSSNRERKLWSVASRADDGGLFEIETIDMTRSPAVSKKSKASTDKQYTGQEKHFENKDEVDGPDTVAHMSHDHEGKRTDNFSPIGGLPQVESSNNPLTHQALKSTSSKFSTQDKSLPDRQKTSGNSQVVKVPEKPNYAAYTKAQLAKELASYHFKPIKNRDQMITLLEKCWDSNLRTKSRAGDAGITSDEASRTTSTCTTDAMITLGKLRGRPMSPANVTPKSLLGRPKNKDTQLVVLGDDEVMTKLPSPQKSPSKTRQLPAASSDLGATLSGSPRHRRNPQVTRSPRKPTSQGIDGSSKLLATSTNDIIFTHISRAVICSRPSKDPAHPTWLERILIYDPVILEDLTAWLNTGALEKVGWDGEVGPLEVKKWCESKSICCLWKENLRGKARSRF